MKSVLVCLPLSLLLVLPGAAQTAVSPVSGIVQALQQERYEAAAEQANEQLKVRPNDPRLWTLKGMALAGSNAGDPGAAIAAYRHALSISPDYLPALEAAAQMEYESGDRDARKDLDHLLQFRPNEPTAHAMLAELDFQAGDFSGAIGHFADAEPVIQTQWLPLAHYGTSLGKMGKHDDAEVVFERSAALRPGDPVAAYNLALARFQNHHVEAALATLQPLLNESSPSVASLTLGADLEEALGHTQRSLDLLHRAVLQHPDEPEAYLSMAYLSFAHSSVQVGIDILEKGLARMRANAELYLARGVLLAQLGRDVEATRDFETANRLDPSTALGHTALGITQSQQHKPGEALESFRLAARQHPDDALAQYLLAEALSDLSPAMAGAEGKEALAAAERAVQLDPKMVAAHDLLATMYLRDNQVDKVTEQSEAALAIAPHDQQAIFHLILAARRGVHKDQLPSLVQRLKAAQSAADDPLERPRGFLVEAK